MAWYFERDRKCVRTEEEVEHLPDFLRCGCVVQFQPFYFLFSPLLQELFFFFCLFIEERERKRNRECVGGCYRPERMEQMAFLSVLYI